MKLDNKVQVIIVTYTNHTKSGTHTHELARTYRQAMARLRCFLQAGAEPSTLITDAMLSPRSIKAVAHASWQEKEGWQV